MEQRSEDPKVYQTSVFIEDAPTHTNSPSAVSWPVIFAGAIAASTITFLLLVLGFGLGLSVLPWSYDRGAIGISTCISIIIIELVASAVGGYLVGRLRVKGKGGTDGHSKEARFRDAAHGLLSWSVASLLTVAVIALMVRVVLSDLTEISAGAAAIITPTVASGNNDYSAAGTTVDYFTDMLLRERDDQTSSAASDTNNDAVRSEVTKILIASLYYGDLAPTDRDYLARVIAKRTNLSPQEAERRVNDIYHKAKNTISDIQASAKQTAEKVRQIAAQSALWLFGALIHGAFIASLMALLGGYQRDKITS